MEKSKLNIINYLIPKRRIFFLRHVSSFIPLAMIFMVTLLFSAATGYSATGSNEVHIIQLNDDTINPVTAEYIVNAIDNAAARNAVCLIIKLDTPGGLLSSTRLIVKKILSSTVPVVVYISPGGSRAGSAGVFLTYASHIAAMAPSTNIGAAHPVQLGGGEGGRRRDLWDGLKELIDKSSSNKRSGGDKTAEEKEEIQEENGKKKQEGNDDEKAHTLQDIEPDEDPMSSKILQDTVAFIKSMAQKRGRNMEWAIKSVTKSSSITETEAKELGVIEIIARDDRELLEKLDGRVVRVEDVEIILNTKGAFVKRIEMKPRQKFLNILANPNIAYILMILGFYGLLYEVTHPGIGVPGIMGVIFLILAFYSMQTLPTNYAGAALILLGLVLFAAEAYAPGLGLLTLGGLVCVILGSLFLFDYSSAPMMRVSLSLILSFSAATAGLTIFLVRSVICAHTKKILSGQEGMIGTKGEVIKTVSADKDGKVFVHGELWNAVADETIKKGEKVVVREINGMMLKVEITKGVSS